jgi:hypothetical protein
MSKIPPQKRAFLAAKKQGQKLAVKGSGEHGKLSKPFALRKISWSDLAATLNYIYGQWRESFGENNSGP